MNKKKIGKLETLICDELVKFYGDCGKSYMIGFEIINKIHPKYYESLPPITDERLKEMFPNYEEE